jgi:hypothetical protein
MNSIGNGKQGERNGAVVELWVGHLISLMPTMHEIDCLLQPAQLKLSLRILGLGLPAHLVLPPSDRWGQSENVILCLGRTNF